MTKSKKKRQEAQRPPHSLDRLATKGAKRADKDDDDDGILLESAAASSSPLKLSARNGSVLFLVSVLIGLLSVYLSGGYKGWLGGEKRNASVNSTKEKAASSATTTTTSSSPPPDDFPPEVKMSIEKIMARAKKQPCKDRKDARTCAAMAKQGNCKYAPGWMAVMCSATCARCDLLDPKVRCSFENMNATGKNAYEPGDMNRMFESLLGRSDVKVMHEGEPWVLLIENFVSDLEVRTLLELTDKDLQRSTDQGKFDETGVQEQIVSQSRTSSNAWCGVGCEDNATVANLMNRISEFVHVPVENFESFQVLRYDVTQKYDHHHDASPLDFSMPAGPRVLTFFLYLSDVEEGGETHFPLLNDLKVKPKKGSALLWPSVHSDDLGKIQSKTTHAALPVIKGVKRAANSWLHLRDYRAPNLWVGFFYWGIPFERD